MDKYEYNLKLEEIDRLVDQEDYEAAANLADTIDWKRVRNVRTLCLVSEIYEAAERLEDSKRILQRAYKKSPVGKTVLYRLVEVTTALEQYDEALEYYTEYVQAAPHDNNRYILKYRIYSGRGSAIEERIAILEEYLGQEYVDRWAYELAKLYQQAGLMQKCLATCDDLVLWFRNGKYVRKALELKKKYASLTPKQQQVYEECIQLEAREELEREEEHPEEMEDSAVVVNLEGADDDMLAEKIIAETEREIASEVAAHKAKLEKQRVPAEEPESAEMKIVADGKTSQSEHAGTGGKGAGAAGELPDSDSVSQGVAGDVPQAVAPMPQRMGDDVPQAVAPMPQRTGDDVQAGDDALRSVDRDVPQAVASMPQRMGDDVQAGDDALRSVDRGAPQAVASMPQRMGDDVQAGDDAPRSVDRDVPQAVASMPQRTDRDMPQRVNSEVSELRVSGNAAAQSPEESAAFDQEKLQAELVKSMREIVSGVARRPEIPEEDLPASVESRIQLTKKVEIPAVQEQKVGRLSIDDVLLSMGDKGRRIAEQALQAQEAEEARKQALQAQEAEARKQALQAQEAEEARKQALQVQEAENARKQAQEAENEKKQALEAQDIEEARRQAEQAQEALRAREVEAIRKQAAAAQSAETDGQSGEGGAFGSRSGQAAAGGAVTLAAMAEQELTDAQREALQYTSNPEKLLRNKSALPTYTEDHSVSGSTKRVPSRDELLEEAKRRLFADNRMNAASGSLDLPAVDQREQPSGKAIPQGMAEVEMAEAVPQGTAADDPVENSSEPEPGRTGGLPYVAAPGEENREAAELGREAIYAAAEEMSEADRIAAPEVQDTEKQYDALEKAGEDGTAEDLADHKPEEEYEGQPEDLMVIPEHLRYLFDGFTQIPELEDQIANAIIQMEAKGQDRTSKSGNVLIFGDHGSGKTTIAMNLARAVAQDRGVEAAKMAKIYASELNKKDIAATVAKIAGGVLIVEEAGDLDDNTIDQLTTAMEFRTDGLIVILEDDQKFMHELLMRHPRFTMKFTAQIYIPIYTAEELGEFGQIYANSKDYVIGEDGLEALYSCISDLSSLEEGVTIGMVIELVEKAIQKSNGFFRKMTMGKKRFDENDYIILFAKDFKF